ncbi:hypothetical protein QE152_g35153 [Popillia japonica]|uniref:Uncharacterized protein n=1 Tax=Popillia japonica TaxID=7064 RepID=A0AAW1IRH9_POPJA
MDDSHRRVQKPTKRLDRVSLETHANEIIRNNNSICQFSEILSQKCDVTCRHRLLLKLNELEDILLQDNDEVEVVLVPPDGGDITDEDSGDEDEINLQRLARRMLRANIEKSLVKMK